MTIYVCPPNLRFEFGNGKRLRNKDDFFIWEAQKLIGVSKKKILVTNRHFFCINRIKFSNKRFFSDRFYHIHAF